MGKVLKNLFFTISSGTHITELLQQTESQRRIKQTVLFGVLAESVLAISSEGSDGVSVKRGIYFQHFLKYPDIKIIIY